MKMEDGRWRFNHRFKLRPSTTMTAVVWTILLLFLLQNPSFCLCLNSEGMALLRFRERIVRDPFGALSDWNDIDGGDVDPCSWFGVECSDGKVVILDLKDLCLGGTLSPELGKLAYIKSIILRNNSFSGTVPREIGNLKELEVLDLGYNNFSGSFPSDLGNNLSLAILLLDNNKFLGSISPELYELKMLSEFQVDENQLTSAALGASCISRSIPCAQRSSIAYRRNLQEPTKAKRNKSNKGSSKSASSTSSLSPSPSPVSPSMAPADSPFSSSSFPPSTFPSSSPESPLSSPAVSPFGIFLPPSYSPGIPPIPASPAPRNPPIIVFEPPPSRSAPMPSSASTPSQVAKSSKSKNYTVPILSGVVGGILLIFVLGIGIIFCRRHKVISVNPWATGLSGQLQKAFVAGVPKLRRSELETACEDFSNIIGSLSDGTVYKGTLSSGVEIAVMSFSATSQKYWSKNLEGQYRNKIDTLSKVNHKNFLNLIGFCEEDDPFTRMMVFEYAPNGTLFEHLHVMEAEHLDWGMRLRIVMGMAYSLEYMHQLTPPIAHGNLQSSSVYLTEDYAAKISDFSFWNEITASKMGPASTESMETTSTYLESNVYSFGVILFEMITCRFPYSEEKGSLADCTSDYLRGELAIREMVDPTLESYQEEELVKLLEVIKDCVNPDPDQRPTMSVITTRLKEITAMGPDGAIPKLSALWWAELEIMSSEGS